MGSSPDVSGNRFAALAHAETASEEPDEEKKWSKSKSRRQAKARKAARTQKLENMDPWKDAGKNSVIDGGENVSAAAENEEEEIEDVKVGQVGSLEVVSRHCCIFCRPR